MFGVDSVYVGASANVTFAYSQKPENTRIEYLCFQEKIPPGKNQIELNIPLSNPRFEYAAT